MRKKSMFAIVLIIILTVALALSFSGCSKEKAKMGDANKIDTLQVADSGKIKVLQLTDLHLTKGRDIVYDRQTYQWVEEAIDTVKPDIVAMTGDTVGSIYGRDQAMIQLANMLEEKKVYWMYTFGNHDGEWSNATKEDVGKKETLAEQEIGRRELKELLKGYEYSLMVEDENDGDGVSNYTIKWTDKDGKIVHVMVNMDTHGKLYSGGKDMGYIGVQLNQVEWYKSKMDSYKYADGSYPSSSIYMHVPLIQYQEAWEDKDNHHIRDYPAIELESKCYAPKEDIGMFDAMKAKGSDFVTAGHDHHFSWMRSIDNIYMNYGRVSGVNAYARYVPIGATVIEIDTKATTTRDRYKLSVVEPSFEYNPWQGQKIEK